MLVVFQRTGRRRYRVEVRRPPFAAVEMNPAPGYDELMPHDLMHLVVESQLGLERGVFGQLAAGGHAGTFRSSLEPSKSTRDAARQRRRMNHRGKKLLRDGRDDCAQSETATYICWHEWLARSALKERRKVAQTMSDEAKSVSARTQSPTISEDKLKQICRHLDELSLYWSRLKIGDSMTVQWPDLSVSTVDNL